MRAVFERIQSAVKPAHSKNVECGGLTPLWLENSMNQETRNSSTENVRTESVQSAVEPAQSEASESCVKPQHSKDWPHAPVHRLGNSGVYMVTAGTLYKVHLFREDERLKLLESSLLSLAKKYDWQLEAWAVFSNHYHFVGRSPQDAGSLKGFLSHLHTQTASELNRWDKTPGRKVWFNFWDSQLTFERSYLARLHYVHQNPVKHGLAPLANQYRWCSAAWFERVASTAMIKTIYSFKIDKLEVFDDF